MTYCKYINNRIKTFIRIISEFIHFSFQINASCQNQDCTFHNFLQNTQKFLDDNTHKSEVERVEISKKFYEDNLIVFSITENVFNRKKCQ